MTLPTSGPLSLNAIHIEAGGTTGTLASINDADIRALIGKASGATMSFSEWYGASSLLTLAAQSSSTTGPTTSTTVTLPSFSAGDIALAVVTANLYSEQGGGQPFVSTPAGWSVASSNQSYSAGPFTKGEFFDRMAMAVFYKVLSAGDTSFSVSGGTRYATVVNIYRPSAAISSVTVNDVATTSSNTINCSAASASVIAFGAAIGVADVPQTWGAGPTYTNALTILGDYTTHYMSGASYVQSTNSPSDVSWSSTGTKFASGYLEVT